MRTHYHSNAVNDFNGDHIEREEIVENREETPTTILPETAILQMATGHYLSRALGFAAKHRIPDFLVDRPLHYREIAIKIAADPESLNRLLRLLAVAVSSTKGRWGIFSWTSWTSVAQRFAKINASDGASIRRRLCSPVLEPPRLLYQYGTIRLSRDNAGRSGLFCEPRDGPSYGSNL
jgi:hypothetical protein